LAYFTASLFKNTKITKVNSSGLVILIYSVDKENELGILAEAVTFS